MPKVVRRLMQVVAATIVAAGLLVAGLYWAAQQPPRFYEESLARQATNEVANPERLEQQALALHNQINHDGRFEVRFKEDEINGWLAEELPLRFPRLLNAALSEPRVAIEEGTLRLAVRYRRGNIDTVLSLAADARLTGQSNELAIRIHHVRAGLVPVPLGRLLEDVQQKATRAGIPLAWTEEGGDPVVLVRVPSETTEGDGDNGDQAAPRRFVLEDVRLEKDALIVVGRMESPTPQQRDETTPVDTAGQPAENETQQR